MITPNQIKEKQISTAAHGYDIDETNAFLTVLFIPRCRAFSENS